MKVVVGVVVLGAVCLLLLLMSAWGPKMPPLICPAVETVPTHYNGVVPGSFEITKLNVSVTYPSEIRNSYHPMCDPGDTRFCMQNDPVIPRSRFTMFSWTSILNFLWGLSKLFSSVIFIQKLPITPAPDWKAVGNDTAITYTWEGEEVIDIFYTHAQHQDTDFRFAVKKILQNKNIPEWDWQALSVTDAQGNHVDWHEMITPDAVFPLHVTGTFCAWTAVRALEELVEVSREQCGVQEEMRGLSSANQKYAGVDMLCYVKISGVRDQQGEQSVSINGIYVATVELPNTVTFVRQVTPGSPKFRLFKEDGEWQVRDEKETCYLRCGTRGVTFPPQATAWRVPKLGSKTEFEVQHGVSVAWTGAPDKGTVHVKILRAEALPNVDCGGFGGFVGDFSDPYVKVRSVNMQPPQYETNVVSNNLNPVWDKEFVFEYDAAIIWCTLILEVWDSEASGDRMLGTTTVNLEDIEADAEVTFEEELKHDKRIKCGKLHFQVTLKAGGQSMSKGQVESALNTYEEEAVMLKLLVAEVSRRRIRERAANKAFSGVWREMVQLQDQVKDKVREIDVLMRVSAVKYGPSDGIGAASAGFLHTELTALKSKTEQKEQDYKKLTIEFKERQKELGEAELERSKLEEKEKAGLDKGSVIRSKIVAAGHRASAYMDPKQEFGVAIDLAVVIPQLGTFEPEKLRGWMNKRLQLPAKKFSMTMPWTVQQSLALFACIASETIIECMVKGLYGHPSLLFFYSVGFPLTFRAEVYLSHLCLVLRMLVVQYQIDIISHNDSFSLTREGPLRWCALGSLYCLLIFLLLMVVPFLIITIIGAIPAAVTSVLFWNYPTGLGPMRRIHIIAISTASFLWLLLVSWMSRRWWTGDTYLCPYSHLKLLSISPESVGGFIFITGAMSLVLGVVTAAKLVPSLVTVDFMIDLWLFHSHHSSPLFNYDANAKQFHERETSQTPTTGNCTSKVADAFMSFCVGFKQQCQVLMTWLCAVVLHASPRPAAELEEPLLDND